MSWFAYTLGFVLSFATLSTWWWTQNDTRAALKDGLDDIMVHTEHNGGGVYRAM